MKQIKMEITFEDDTAEEAEKNARLFFQMLAGDTAFFARLRRNGKAGALYAPVLTPGEGERMVAKGRSAEIKAELKEARR